MSQPVLNGENDEARAGTDHEAVKRGYAQHLKYGLARDRYASTFHDRFLALASTVRDRLIARWIETQQHHHLSKAKRVYYLSMEYLLGRALGQNVVNLGIEREVKRAMDDLGLDWEAICEEEADPGLGNGGLGRLAACFLDSLATLGYPAFGYGLRYDYGMFRQRIENGYQVEEPDDWLRMGNPWEIPRPDFRIPVYFGGRVEFAHEWGRLFAKWLDARPVMGIPYDTPVVGHGGQTVNTLRLWSARSAEEFDLQDFNAGDYVAAVEAKIGAETLTKVLYPNDAVSAGRELRLKQEYFLVACSLHDILRRFKADFTEWKDLPRAAAIQMNDTHPALAVPELMRLLLDREGLEWDESWDLTQRCLGYTNHTLLPEALEKWPVDVVERLLPRHWQIICEINRRFLDAVRVHFPGDEDRVRRMSMIEEGPVRQVRMAHLCMAGSHSTNGVARLHTELLKHRVVPDFWAMCPERFHSMTNGITPRRWLLKANPRLAALITEAIGDRWIRDLFELKKLAPLAGDAAFRDRFRAVKRANKEDLANYVASRHGFAVDPDSIFDVHVKRLHEYKRQLLNALHIVVLYHRLRKNPAAAMPLRTFFFAAKAAPGYWMAKLLIKFIHNIAAVVDSDPSVAGRIKVCFVPNYGVSLAERIIPAADLSEQISTAGTEASGTGNMKFMLNGALTIGTLDGANIEMMDAVGRSNMFIFGLTAEEIACSAHAYDPRHEYGRDPEIREGLDLAFSGLFDLGQPGLFEPIRRALLDYGDRYRHLADLPSYTVAHRDAAELWMKPEEWTSKAILNIAASGVFSSDRTINEYARQIWGVQPCVADGERVNWAAVYQVV